MDTHLHRISQAAPRASVASIAYSVPAGPLPQPSAVEHGWHIIVAGSYAASVAAIPVGDAIVSQLPGGRKLCIGIARACFASTIGTTVVNVIALIVWLVLEAYGDYSFSAWACRVLGRWCHATRRGGFVLGFLAVSTLTSCGAAAVGGSLVSALPFDGESSQPWASFSFQGIYFDVALGIPIVCFALIALYFLFALVRSVRSPPSPDPEALVRGHQIGSASDSTLADNHSCEKVNEKTDSPPRRRSYPARRPSLPSLPPHVTAHPHPLSSSALPVAASQHPPPPSRPLASVNPARPSVIYTSPPPTLTTFSWPPPMTPTSPSSYTAPHTAPASPTSPGLNSAHRVRFSVSSIPAVSSPLAQTMTFSPPGSPGEAALSSALPADDEKCDQPSPASPPLSHEGGSKDLEAQHEKAVADSSDEIIPPRRHHERRESYVVPGDS